MLTQVFSKTQPNKQFSWNNNLNPKGFIQDFEREYTTRLEVKHSLVVYKEKAVTWRSNSGKEGSFRHLVSIVMVSSNLCS